MNSYQVRIYTTSWNALPTWYTDFPSAHSKAKEQIDKYTMVSVWERKSNEDKVARIVWTSDFGGINEFKKYRDLSTTYQKVYEFYKMQRDSGPQPSRNLARSRNPAG